MLDRSLGALRATTSTWRPFQPLDFAQAHAEKFWKFKSHQEISMSGSQKYCRKLYTNPVDHVLWDTVRVEVTRIFVTEEQQEKEEMPIE